MKKKIPIASRWFHKYFHIGIAIFKFLLEKKAKKLSNRWEVGYISKVLSRKGRKG